MPHLPGLDSSAMDAARQRWATRAMPPGALGLLQDLGVRLAGITGLCPPLVPKRPVVVVFAGDHGVVRDGASAWPSDVTALMAKTMADGTAAINALARTVGATVAVVDVGIAGELGPDTGVERRRVRSGTDSLLHGPAMDREEAIASMEVGRARASEAVDDGADLLVAGDMGIGNTTAAACLIGAVCDAPADEVVGPGAGTPAAGIGRKIEIVDAALRRVKGWTDPIELVRSVGGLEIAAMAGFTMEGAARGVPVVSDGVISLASVLVADVVQPGTAARCIAGHRSTEPGATIALAHLDQRPLLDLELRLGEGTGAALAIPLVQAAARALADMAELPV